jgi:dihydroorotase
MKDLLIKHGNVYTENGFFQKDILCKDGVIVKIEENICGKDFIEADKLSISPGFLDLHTHLREPGEPHKETIATGTEAALRGGFTTVCSMPNVNPVPDSLENLAVQTEIINRYAHCVVLPYMSITKNRAGKEVIDMSLIPDGCAGVSDDGAGVQSDKVMELAMKMAAENNILISAHCEDFKLSPKNESEWTQIRRDLKLVKKYRCRYHVCHVSCRESLEMIKEAKMAGLPVTCEVTPHHTLLCREDISEDSGKFKMSPQLRSKADKEAVISSLLDGTIDAIATDHAPHSDEEKNFGYSKSANGVVGLECAFGVLYNDLVYTNRMPFGRLLELFTGGPRGVLARRHGSGKIEVGEKADITIIDTNKEWVIDSKNFVSKGKSTPFDGKNVVGKVVMTVFNGKIVYNGM